MDRRNRCVIPLLLGLGLVVAGCAARAGAPPGESAGAAGPRIRLQRGPFVQYVTPDAAVVEWIALCDEAGESPCSQLEPIPALPGDPPVTKVVWVREAHNDGGARLIDHRVELKGLEPGRVYTYSILGEDGSDLRPGDGQPFVLGPIPSPGSLRFAVLGDTGSGSEDQYGIARLLEREPFELGFIDGDIVLYPCGEEDYDAKYFLPYKNVLTRAPLYPVLGNHDTGEYWPLETREVLALSLFDVFRGELPEDSGFQGPSAPRRYYSTAIGPALFVALDSTDVTGDLFLPVEEHEGPGHENCQWNWLRAELARPGFRWKFVLLHHPPFSSGMHSGRGGGAAGWPTRGLFHLANGFGWAWNPVLGWTGVRIPRAPAPSDLEALRASLTDLFAAANVDVVFTSHDHDFEITRPIRGYEVESGRAILGEGPRGECPTDAAPSEGECVFEKGQGPVYVVTGGGGRPLRPVARSEWTVTSFSDYHALILEIAGQELSIRVEPQGLRYSFR